LDPLPHHIENQLVKNLKKGDILAFNELFGYYGRRLYHFSFRYLRSEPECEELVQEVFTRVWEKRSELKEDLSFRSYIFTIAFNIIRKHFHSRLQEGNYVGSQAVEDLNLETSENVDFNLLKSKLDDLVSMLPSRRKEIFTKSRFEGLSVKEIAAAMNISKKTVENQLTEALRFIRSHLTNEHLMGLLFFYLFIS
jgi:RNA polymerase sigma-70 factor (family 1)